MRVVERSLDGYDDRALYSDDMAYRYEFRRRWGPPGAGTVVWVLLNPATGDADGKPRPTLRGCSAWSGSGDMAD